MPDWQVGMEINLYNACAKHFRCYDYKFCENNEACCYRSDYVVCVRLYNFVEKIITVDLCA